MLCVCRCMHVYVWIFRACGHHSVHLTGENKLEVRMIMLFVVVIIVVCLPVVFDVLPLHPLVSYNVKNFTDTLCTFKRLILSAVLKRIQILTHTQIYIRININFLLDMRPASTCSLIRPVVEKGRTNRIQMQTHTYESGWIVRWVFLHSVFPFNFFHLI